LFGLLLLTALARDQEPAITSEAPGILYFVNTTADTVVVGACENGNPGCSLRGAIQAANAHPGADGIEIDLASGSVVNLPQALPDITESDGTDVGAFEKTVFRITSITRLPNGHILLQGLGIPNRAHTMEFSSNPSPNSFAPFPTMPIADGTGAIQYDDATAVGLSKQFYRLRFP